MFAEAPRDGCVAVIFTSLRTTIDGVPVDDEAYARTAERMVQLAAEQPGYLGVESARGVDGLGITVSYWAGERDALAWRAVAEHAAAREAGRDRWYQRYELRVATVQRSYGWERDPH
jgi:heme-degrading monooxygenase HmoA